MIATQIELAEQVEMMRVIRNTCAPYMTGNQQSISEAAQAAWWKDLDRERYRCFLFDIGVGAPHFVGYGIVDEQPRKSWLTAGLLPEARGLGLGRQAFTLLIEVSYSQPWLRVLRSNERAWRLYCSMGFEVMGEEQQALVMRYGEGKERTGRNQ